MRASDDERLARLGLSQLAEPNDPVLWAAVHREGPVQVLEAVLAGRSRLPDESHYLSRAAGLDPAGCLAAAGESGSRYVVPGDLEWPSQLADAELPAGEGQPTAVPPLGLWVRGPLHLRTSVLRSAAVVGSRAATSYGIRVSSELASGLSDRGWAVVSGGAYGIDAAAHRGALAVAGQTVCVLACGVDLAYPRSHATLISRIAVEGLVVSELPPGSGPTKARFLDRNRLIAALTPGTVLVEAAFRSGALNTARWAGRMGRRLLAVPGPVTSPLSLGPHDLVRDGRAVLVAGAADVVRELGTLAEAFDAAAAEGLLEEELRRVSQRDDDHLDRFLRRTLDALSRSRWRTLADVRMRAGLDEAVARGALGHLVEVGLAHEHGGRYRASP